MMSTTSKSPEYEGSIESACARCTAMVTADGPTYLSGEIAIVVGEGAVRRATQITLCRCGASSNKPYCDGSHQGTGFQDAGKLPADLPAASVGVGTLTITPRRNGPLKCEGTLELVGTDGRSSIAVETFLCRCGASGRKPYCDGTHKRIGFVG
jgi:CDGSH-type Zn-finger protein